MDCSIYLALFVRGISHFALLHLSTALIRITAREHNLSMNPSWSKDLVNEKKQFLLKLSSGTVTRTQSPNQRDVPNKLIRKWKPKQPRKNVVRLKTWKERSQKTGIFLGETSEVSKILQWILFFFRSFVIFLYLQTLWALRGSWALAVGAVYLTC